MKGVRQNSFLLSRHYPQHPHEKHSHPEGPDRPDCRRRDHRVRGIPDVELEHAVRGERDDKNAHEVHYIIENGQNWAGRDKGQERCPGSCEDEP